MRIGTVHSVFMKLIIEEQAINVNVFVGTDSDGRCTRAKLFYPQMTQMDADLKKTRAAAAALVQ